MFLSECLCVYSGDVYFLIILHYTGYHSTFGQLSPGHVSCGTGSECFRSGSGPSSPEQVSPDIPVPIPASDSQFLSECQRLKHSSVDSAFLISVWGRHCNAHVYTLLLFSIFAVDDDATNSCGPDTG